VRRYQKKTKLQLYVAAVCVAYDFPNYPTIAAVTIGACDCVSPAPVDPLGGDGPQTRVNT